ncbi:deleted in malignant brain tumors 1 protein [Electrophorus electricus]|uniref:deleted in malignant brain tumors 1 protein n=1 Tax=Electrophorus electricus TaxID=8005 RepID=UPI0015D06005|nr:deleted in malignant brain tumors 1 protein [Electrophorus electricus]
MKLGIVSALLGSLLVEVTFTATSWPWTTAYDSCWGNCGFYLSSCSCTTGCVYNGNCCQDFNAYCHQTTEDNRGTPTPSGVVGSCGGYFTQWSGEFASPQYPSNYPNYAHCSWRIQSPGTKIISLTFTFVSVEGSPPCRHDAIQVYDGPSTSYPLLGKLCGSQLKEFRSSRNQLTVVFSSDSSVSGRGFRAHWLFVGTSTPVTPTVLPSCRWNCGNYFSSCSCSSSCLYNGNCCHDYYDYCYSTTDIPEITTDSRSCGGRLSGSGSLTSPFYPNYYHDRSNCEWQLSAPAGQRIFLSFVDLDLERCCSCDYVRVYDGPSTNSPLLATMCFNDTRQNFHSSSSNMTVLFRSDISVVARGFKALFSSSLPSNLGHVNCSSGNMTIVIQRSYLSSLGFSWQDLYLDDHHCMPSSVGYDVSFSFPLNMCGTNKEISNGHVVYTNNVRAAHSQSGEITRQTQYFLLHVSCHMERDTTVGNLYQAQEVANSTITGVGRFNATMRFYLSSSFSYPVLESPYVVQLNQYVYVQVQLTRQDSSLDVFLDSCVASPNHDFQTRNYDLLRNGCVRDRTVYVYTNGLRPYARFRFQAFKFLRTHAYVFLRCKVVVCANNDYNSRCRRGCQYRRKRAIDSVLHTRAVTLGPITLQGAQHVVESDSEE